MRPQMDDLHRQPEGLEHEQIPRLWQGRECAGCPPPYSTVGDGINQFFGLDYSTFQIIMNQFVNRIFAVELNRMSLESSKFAETKD